MTVSNATHNQSTQQNFFATSGVYQETDIHLVGEPVVGETWTLTITSKDNNNVAFIGNYSYLVGSNGDPVTMVTVAQRLAEAVNADTISVLTAEDAGPEPIIHGLTDRGDRYAVGAEVESLKDARLNQEIFENATLVGGDSNNTLVVNDGDNSIIIGGVSRLVSNWQGSVTLDSLGSSGLFNEYYLVSLKGTRARYSVNDSGGTASYDELYVLGTPAQDQFTLDASGSIGYVFSGSLVDTRFPYAASVTSTTIFPTRTTVASDVMVTGPSSMSSRMKVFKNRIPHAVTYTDKTGTFRIMAETASSGAIAAGHLWSVVLDGIFYNYTTIEGDTDARSPRRSKP